MDKTLKYDELKLGEKAIEMYLSGASIEDIRESSAIYTNTRNVLYGLNVTDLAIAAVLGGVNLLLTGDSGTGKSQLAQDFYRYYFGGNKRDGGEAVKIRGYKLTERTLDELVFEELNLEKGRWDLTENVDATYFLVDEINRAPTIRQNDCFELGDGILNKNGRDIPVGKEGYGILVATANIGNGEFQGTFEIDKAMYNRLGVVIDFDYSDFEPTMEDREFTKILREADPGIKRAPKRNITDKIIQAYKQISKDSLDLGIEGDAVLKFLQYSLRNCPKKKNQGNDKSHKWYIQNQFCQACELNKDAPSHFALCSSINAPVTRTLEATRKYAAALNFLAEIKGIKDLIDPKDLVFKAFELTGAYQGILNPFQLKNKYYSENPRMMAEIVERLKEEYNKQEERIITTLSAAKEGVEPSSLFYLKLPGEKKKRLRKHGLEEIVSRKVKINAMRGEISTKEFEFDDKGELGYSWVRKLAEMEARNHSRIEKLKNK